MAADLSQLVEDVSDFRQRVAALKARLVLQAKELRTLGNEAATLLDAALHLLKEGETTGDEWKGADE